MIWACPLCREALALTDKGVVCPANHQFDRAKQGYLNLLPAHHRRSAAPGDDKQMLSQRREFLEAGFYTPLVEMIFEVLSSTGSKSPLRLLDSGCGEGYYLNELMARMQMIGRAIESYGFDISKEAAKLASRKLLSGADAPKASIAVASSFQLPVISESVDVLLRIFSPGDPQEVARVLKPTGEFWRVVPGSHHLYELKQALYETVRLHELPGTPSGFDRIDSTETRFTMALNSKDSMGQLLQMTPFVWRGSEEGKKHLQRCEQMNVTAHFVLQRYRKVGKQ